MAVVSHEVGLFAIMGRTWLFDKWALGQVSKRHVIWVDEISLGIGFELACDGRKDRTEETEVGG